MKTIKTLAQMSAIALVGTFAACSSDDDKVQNINPTYDGKSVKTQFAINIPRAAQQTRQTAEITQNNNNNFRGMQDVVLYSATADPESATELNKITTLEENIDGTLEGEHRKVYSDVQVPVGTSHFLFYGQATEDDNEFNNGVLTATYPTSPLTPAGISFALKQIYSGTLSDADLLSYLNDICQVSGWKDAEVNSQLGVAYKGFTFLKAGSSASILKAVERLYNSVEPLANGTGEQKDLADEISTKIKDYFEIEGSENPYTLKYRSYTKEFPQNENLPEGVAQLTFNAETNSFSYVGTAAFGTTFNNINTQKITYPAALYYYAETDLKTSISDTPSWPADLAAWGRDASWTGWGNAVTATTRTIALRQPINYGVALLKTNVKTAASLLDNAVSQGGAANDNNIHVGDQTFPVTAILIGGQPGQVNWEFNPSGEHDYTIYDNVMNGTIYATTSNDVYNYTMALDNHAETEEEVHIAIELQNNSERDFYGVDGLVPAGSKFYLVALLDPDGKGDPGRVFAKDYVTTANLTIKSLKNAYMTIPDLRSTQLQLGLAVDLSWQNGLTFDVDIE